MKIWSDKEVIDLFGEVERCKQNAEALCLAFVNHAKKYGRKPNSVRNYYYHEVDNLKNDDKRCKSLQIEIKNHDKSHFVTFDKVQEEELFENIEKQVERGVSVRAACLKISGGDLVQMTRFQNKYQNMKRRLKDNLQSNIIPFKQKQKTLTEGDLNSLFLGLVKLIKKTAVDDLIKEFEVLREENKRLKDKIQQLQANKTEILKRHLTKKKTEARLEV